MHKTSQTHVNKGTPATIYLDVGKFISDYIPSLPHGMIDKQYPGIGATTLELGDNTRNSIVVFPTRSLAATKAKGKNIHYVGSYYQDVPSSTAEEILSDLEAGTLVKIAAVADSFISLYRKLKVKFHEYKFFIVLDEVDSFQTESNYRPRLEECIDIYFEFHPERRSLVSATLEQFSDKRLSQESKTTIVVDNYVPPTIHLINATKSVIKVAADYIVNAALTGEKLFIAFNSIEGILKILKLLPEDLVSQSGIMCSTNSTDKIKAYAASELVDGLLKHRITFFTSAFFVGLDVLEPVDSVHTLIIADTSLPVSLLSIAKIRQILGRVRKGSSKNTFILNCVDKGYQPVSSYDKHLEQVQHAYEDVINSIYSSFSSIGLHEQANEIEKVLMDKCVIDDVRVLRNVNGKIEISVSNIDHLKLKYRAFKTLYTEFRNTEKNLKTHFIVNRETIHTDLEPAEKLALEGLVALLNDGLLANRTFILENQITDPKLAKGKSNEIITSIWRSSSQLIDQAKVRSAIEAIPVNDIKGLNKILFKVRVFSEDEQSDLWKYINLHFVEKHCYTSDYIHNKTNQMRRALGHGSVFDECTTQNKSVQKLRLIFDTKDKNTNESKKRERLLIRTFRSEYCK